MASAAVKATAITTLQIKNVEVAVGLFSATDKPGKVGDFDTAGPNGGVLKAQAIARAVPVEETVERAEESVKGDPLGDLFEAPATPAPAPAPAGTVDGQYGRQLVEEGTGVVVEPGEVRKGVRREDGSFIDCTEELAAIGERTKLDRMQVIGFVDITRVPRARVKATYYVGAADEKAPRTLRLIFEGLRAKRRGAVVKLTKKSRQSLGVIGWHGDALMLYELVWAEDFRPPPPRATVIKQEKVSEAMVGQMVQLIDAMPMSVDALDELSDDAIRLRRELRARAEAGELGDMKAVIAEPDEEIEDQLAASLGGDRVMTTAVGEAQ